MNVRAGQVFYTALVLAAVSQSGRVIRQVQTHDCAVRLDALAVDPLSEPRACPASGSPYLLEVLQNGSAMVGCPWPGHDEAYAAELSNGGMTAAPAYPRLAPQVERPSLPLLGAVYIGGGMLLLLWGIMAGFSAASLWKEARRANTRAKRNSAYGTLAAWALAGAWLASRLADIFFPS